MLNTIMSQPTLVPVLSTTPNQPSTYNTGIAETFSWIPIDNDCNRPLYARANYVTNLKDISISLSASNVNIGGVEITDGANHSIAATVVQNITEGNSLKVLTQKLNAETDSISIKDLSGHPVTVYEALSSLKVYITNPNVISAPYAFTQCETRTSGNPSFISRQVLFHNGSNSDVDVILTLTSGLTCAIPVGKSTSANHSLTLNLAVSGVNAYNGCILNFFA